MRRFLIEHLVGERNLARNTQRSYRDTFCQLMPFTAQDAGKAVDLLMVEDLSPDRVRRFLAQVEGQRRCTIRTRNQRLAAIHAFVRFVAEHSPEHIAWCAGVRAVPFKRFDRAQLCYLDKPEIDALLAAPDCGSAIGRRDQALVLFLYNTGARASEAAMVAIGDVESRPDGTGSVRLLGKGGKTRCCPLWPTTLTGVQVLCGKRPATDKLFINQRGEPLTRYGIHGIVKRHADAVGASPAQKDQSPHHPAHDRHPSAAGRSGHQHDPSLARACIG